MQGLRGPLAGPLIRPIVGTLTAGIDLVPSIRCFVSERGRAGVVVLVRNQGTVAVPRDFSMDFMAAAPLQPPDFRRIRLRLVLGPGEERTAFVYFPPLPQPVTVTVNVDSLNEIPEEIDKRNNRLTMRCDLGPVVGQPGPQIL